MNPRWLLAFTAVLVSFGSLASAQQPTTVVPYQGYPPVVVNNYGSGDPYATIGVQPAAAWFPQNIAVLPSRESMRGRFWFRTDLLGWRTEGMDLPALVTTSPAGTPQDQAAVLGEPGTSVLFGGQDINGSTIGGVRLRGGMWFSQGAWAIEGESFKLENQSDGYAAGSDGSTILGRPFFDILNGRETAQLISYPNLVAGNIQIASQTSLKSFLINGRASLIPVNGMICGDPCNPPDRVDWIVGYRYLELKDQLAFGENLNSLVTTAPGTVALGESFQSRTRFDGLQLGVVYQANFSRTWLESMLRVAVGNNQQSVRIRGNTSITEAGVTENYTGGLLAQRTNIGDYQRDQFTMIPEVGMTCGVRVTNCLHATLGYTILYYPNVVRAGDQIDTDVNPNLLAPETVPFSGAPRPQFTFVESDYWAHGINLGAELRF